MPTTVVGVGAGIAAYKAVLLVRDLQRAGLDVTVVPTPSSLEFVGAATWEGLTSRPVHTGVFDAGGADHVELARDAELLVIAPATADLLARLRAGLADDLLTTTVLAARCPVLLAPAMHTAMWDNPATRDNVAALRERGYVILEPDSGALGSGDTGAGRLPEPARIARAALDLVDPHPRDLAGVRVLVTAGGTHEPLDPVRYLGNSSSGRQGSALARAAHARGARVTLVASNVDESLLPVGVETVAAPSAADVEREVISRLADTDVLVMAAAVADFRPASVSDTKIKKDPDSGAAPALVLERTPDILWEAAHSSDRPALVIGFAAETGTTDEVLARGREKAQRKGADLLAVNAVGGGLGFGDVTNTWHLLRGDGTEVAVLEGTKDHLADALVEWVAAQMGTMTR